MGAAGRRESGRRARRGGGAKSKGTGGLWAREGSWGPAQAAGERASRIQEVVSLTSGAGRSWSETSKKCEAWPAGGQRTPRVPSSRQAAGTRGARPPLTPPLGTWLRAGGGLPHPDLDLTRDPAAVRRAARAGDGDPLPPGRLQEALGWTER